MPPVNDNLVDATLISADVALIGETTVDATAEAQETSEGYLDNTTWYRIVCADERTRIDVTNASFEYYVEVYSPLVDPPADFSDVTDGFTYSTFVDDIGSGGGADDFLTLDTTVGQVLYLHVVDDLFIGNEGTFDLEVTFLPAPEFNNDDRFTAADDASDGNVQWWGSYFYNDVEEGPLWVTSSGRCMPGTTSGMTPESGDPAIAGFAATRNSWFYFFPSRPGDYEINVVGRGATPLVDSLLAIYYWNIGPLDPSLAEDDDSGAGLLSSLTVTLTEIEYAIAVDGRDDGDFTLEIKLLPVGTSPANDDFADAEGITSGIAFTGTVVDATPECGETPSAGFGINSTGVTRSVWYTYVQTGEASAQIDIDSVGAETQAVDVFTGDSLDELVNITPAQDSWNVFGGGWPPASFQFLAPPGNVYIRISSDYADTGDDFTGTLLAQGIPPDNDDFLNAEVIVA